MEEAYRRLIKEHHPDLNGGNAEAASALNIAYASIRAGWKQTSEAVAVEVRTRKQRTRWRFSLLAGLLGLVLAAGFILIWRLPPLTGQVRSAPMRAAPPPDEHSVISVRAEVDQAAVSSAIMQALHYAEGEHWPQAIDYSENCMQDLERLGSTSLLDHCIAFDHALRLLKPAMESGFSDRQFAAALRVTGDQVLAQSRIDAAIALAELLLVQLQVESLQ